MLKYLLIGVAVIAGWVYFTESGQAFYKGNVRKLWGGADGDKNAFVPNQREVSRLESLIAEKDAKIGVLRKELDAELKFRAANGTNSSFRTDPMFLERTIKRVELDREGLQGQLRQVMRPPPGWTGQPR